MPDPEWNAFCRIDPRPSRQPGTRRPRPNLITIPLNDVEPSHVVLTTRADDHRRLVAAFRKSAQALLTGPDRAD